MLVWSRLHAYQQAASVEHKKIAQPNLTECARRRGISFAASSALIVPEGVSLSLVCPELLQVSLHSREGPPTVAAGATLTMNGCDVLTVSSRDAAASSPPPPEWSSSYFGSSSGTIRLENCRMLMPAEVRHEYGIPLWFRPGLMVHMPGRHPLHWVVMDPLVAKLHAQMLASKPTAGP